MCGKIGQKRLQCGGISRIDHIPTVNREPIAEAASVQLRRVLCRDHVSDEAPMRGIFRSAHILQLISVTPFQTFQVEFQIPADLLGRGSDQYRDVEHVVTEMDQHGDSADMIAVGMRDQDPDLIHRAAHQILRTDLFKPVERRHGTVDQDQPMILYEKCAVLLLEKS